MMGYTGSRMKCYILNEPSTCESLKSLSVLDTELPPDRKSRLPLRYTHVLWNVVCNAVSIAYYLFTVKRNAILRLFRGNGTVHGET